MKTTYVILSTALFIFFAACGGSKNSKLFESNIDNSPLPTFNPPIASASPTVTASPIPTVIPTPTPVTCTTSWSSNTFAYSVQLPNNVPTTNNTVQLIVNATGTLSSIAPTITTLPAGSSFVPTSNPLSGATSNVMTITGSFAHPTPSGNFTATVMVKDLNGNTVSCTSPNIAVARTEIPVPPNAPTCTLQRLDAVYPGHLAAEIKLLPAGNWSSAKIGGITVTAPSMSTFINATNGYNYNIQGEITGPGGTSFCSLIFTAPSCVQTVNQSQVTYNHVYSQMVISGQVSQVFIDGNFIAPPPAPLNIINYNAVISAGAGPRVITGKVISGAGDWNNCNANYTVPAAPYTAIVNVGQTSWGSFSIPAGAYDFGHVISCTAVAQGANNRYAALHLTQQTVNMSMATLVATSIYITPNNNTANSLPSGFSHVFGLPSWVGGTCNNNVAGGILYRPANQIAAGSQVLQNLWISPTAPTPAWVLVGNIPVDASGSNNAITSNVWALYGISN